MLANDEHRGAFHPHDTITSKEPPNFTQRTANFPERQQEYQESRLISTPSTNESTGDFLAELGNSSSLFSYATPSDLEITDRPARHQDSNNAIPFLFGISKEQHKSPTRRNFKMVNERSPAKAPVYPVVAIDQPSESAESIPTKPLGSTIPKFGQPTLPQSPLHRPPPKNSNVFVQPKSRPEHHRGSDRPGVLILPLIEIKLLIYQIAHPHLQAVKDATMKVVDPLLKRSENQYM